MKKLLLFILAAIILSSCSSSEESKAKGLIKEFLKENLNDYKSYESVSFSELKKFQTEFDEELYLGTKKMYQEMLEKEEEMAQMYIDSKIMDDPMKEARQKRLDELKEKIENEAKRIEEKRQEFIQETRYSITHKFRANNLLGTKELNQIDFEFNEDLTEIVEYY